MASPPSSRKTLVSRPPFSHHTHRIGVKVFFSASSGNGPRDPTPGDSPISLSNCGVFQEFPCRHDNYSMLDVRDAIETCAYTRGEERRECFLNFGLSADRVDKYYEPVVKMEELARESTDEDDEMAKRMVKVGGFLLLVGAVVLRRGA